MLLVGNNSFNFSFLTLLPSAVHTTTSCRERWEKSFKSQSWRPLRHLVCVKSFFFLSLSSVRSLSLVFMYSHRKFLYIMPISSLKGWLRAWCDFFNSICLWEMSETLIMANSKMAEEEWAKRREKSFKKGVWWR